MKILLLILLLISNPINSRIEPPEPPSDMPPGSDMPPIPGSDDHHGSDGPGPGPGPDGGYDYSDYQATKMNEDLTNENIACTEPDSSVVYINDTDTIHIITNSIINKEAGTASNRENSEFYGVNAAILVQGGKLEMNGGTINTKVETANALVATNDGEVTITGTNIVSTGKSAARGLHATYGGRITASKVNISSEGGSCANLATDRGEGVVSCTECTLSTKGAGSPLIYSTGDITVDNTEGTATGAQNVVVEGKNKATIKNSSSLKCTAAPNRGDIDQCGVMLYQSMSGDAETGTSYFTCEDSSLEIVSNSNYYTTAPMFFITNTNSEISLKNCVFTYGSKIFLSVKGTSEWGTAGSNGGDVVLKLTNQNIEGNFVIDSISTLKITLVKSTIKGTINGDNKAKNLEITIDAGSTITLTGNSYCNKITNELTDGSNLINGTYSWNKEESPSDSSAKSIFNFSKIILGLSLLLGIIL